MTATSPPGSRGLSDGAEWVCPVGISSASYKPRQSINPIHVLMDWPPLAGETAGSAFRKDLFVVNDFHHPYPALQVNCGSATLRARAPGTAISCGIAANPLTKVAEVVWTMLPTPGACHRITFELMAATGTRAPCPPTSTASPSRAPPPSPPGTVGSHPPTHRPVVQTLSDVLLDLLRLMRHPLNQLN